MRQEEAVIRHTRGATVALVVATLAAVVPILTAAVRAVVKGWLPVGDPGFIAMQGFESLSTDPPLLGMPSSATDQADEIVLHHPGPLQFDVLSVPVHLLGRGAGVALATALVNVAAVVAIVLLTRRSFGTRSAVAAAVLTTLLVWSLGSEVLYDPWPLHTTLLPFALFLVAAWCALAGQRWALPIMVLAGSYAGQTHLAYSVLVPGIALLTGGVLLAQWISARRAAGDATDGERSAKRAEAVRVGVVTGLVGLACWVKPLAQQLVHGRDGNLVALARDASGEGSNPTLGETVRAVGGVLALPPAWLPPSFRRPPFRIDGSGPPTAVAAGGLVLLVALLALLGWRAHRRGARPIAAGSVVAVAGIVLGLVTVLRVPTELAGVSPVYIRWLWGLGMVVWLVIGVALVDEIRHAKISVPVSGARLAMGAAVVALLAGVAAMPTADNGSLTRWWAIDAVHDIDDDLLDALADLDEPIVLELNYSWTSIFVGPALAGRLQDEGISFVTHNKVIAEQMGRDRYLPADEVPEGATRVALRAGPPDPTPREQVLASWSSLSDAELAELDELSAELATAIEEHGLVLTRLGEATVKTLGAESVLALLEEGRDDPETLLESQVLWTMVRDMPGSEAHEPGIDDSAYRPGLLDRWAYLAERRDLEEFALYARPLP